MSLIRLAAALILFGNLATLTALDPTSSQSQWFRGNTHTHTLWSDGDGPPEMVTGWYRDQGYDFLVLSDHNILSQGERWFPVTQKGRLTPARLQQLREDFGEDSVVTRREGDQLQMRLKTLPELKTQFESPDQFLLIQGEEITDAFENIPIHINGLNLSEFIPPQGGQSVREVIQANLDAVLEQGRRLGRPVLAHINHPNFGWALTAKDIAAITGERFFEVYNGHSGVRNYGDDAHLSTERMWDVALTLRLKELGTGLLYGLATDDSHEYYDWGVGEPNPGRGWVMVRAKDLEANAIITALKSGDFYASSGVFLKDLQRTGKRLEIVIQTEPGLTYTTDFIGTRKTPDGAGPVGEVLASTQEIPAVYTMRGDELYVRAKITSSRPHPNPYAAGDPECAWVQPITFHRSRVGNQ